MSTINVSHLKPLEQSILGPGGEVIGTVLQPTTSASYVSVDANQSITVSSSNSSGYNGGYAFFDGTATTPYQYQVFSELTHTDAQVQGMFHLPTPSTPPPSTTRKVLSDASNLPLESLVDAARRFLGQCPKCHKELNFELYTIYNTAPDGSETVERTSLNGECGCRFQTLNTWPGGFILDHIRDIPLDELPDLKIPIDFPRVLAV